MLHINTSEFLFKSYTSLISSEYALVLLSISIDFVKLNLDCSIEHYINYFGSSELPFLIDPDSQDRSGPRPWVI